MKKKVVTSIIYRLLLIAIDYYRKRLEPLFGRSLTLTRCCQHVIIESFSRDIMQFFFYNNCMKKFLDCDWLKEMRFFGNTVQKK